MQAQTTFKLIFGPENIRRFTFQPTTLENFQQLLVALYPDFYHLEMTLQYVDTDGDKVSVSSEMEWEEMLSHSKNSLKLHVVESGNKKFFRDGPAPEVVKVYGEKGQENEGDFQAEIAKVTSALASLFPANKILPYNIPSFLSGIISLQTTGANQVDLDIDFNLGRIANTLHREAMRLFELADKKSVAQAKRILLSQLTLNPVDCVTLYNLACADALLANADMAVEWLKKAVANGYSNFEHMLQDGDLSSLRERADFLGLVPKPAAAPAPQVDVKIPEPVPEVKPEPVPEPAQPQPEKVEDATLSLQLQTLHEMGFLDDSVLMPALQQHGSIDAALSALFQ